MTQEEKIKKDGYIKKCILCCPCCGKELEDERTYGEHTVYHNFIEGYCKLCGHHNHYSVFYKEVFIKH